jgi:hypothetical protein
VHTSYRGQLQKLQHVSIFSKECKKPSGICLLANGWMTNDANHVDICKLKDKRDDGYTKSFSHVGRVSKEIPREAPRQLQTHT